MIFLVSWVRAGLVLKPLARLASAVRPPPKPCQFLTGFKLRPLPYRFRVAPALLKSIDPYFSSLSFSSLVRFSRILRGSAISVSSCFHPAFCVTQLNDAVNSCDTKKERARSAGHRTRSDADYSSAKRAYGPYRRSRQEQGRDALGCYAKVSGSWPRRRISRPGSGAEAAGGGALDHDKTLLAST